MDEFDMLLFCHLSQRQKSQSKITQVEMRQLGCPSGRISKIENIRDFPAVKLRKQICQLLFGCQWDTAKYHVRSSEPSRVGIICFSPDNMRQTITPNHPPPAALRVIIRHEADRHCPVLWPGK